MHISASILACDTFMLKDSLQELKAAECDSIHYDVMDGNYVDQISFGEKLCREISEHTDLPIYVHLMVSDPEKHAQVFSQLNVHGISFHPLDVTQTERIVDLIMLNNKRAGVAVTNDNDIEIISQIPSVDHITLMTVTPGKCGQKFDSTMLKRINTVRNCIKNASNIFVDGGVNCNTIQECVQYGVCKVVVGSYLFAGNITERMKRLKAGEYG